MSGQDAVRDVLPPDWEAARRWAAGMTALVVAVVVGRIVAGPVAAILAGCAVLLVALAAAYVTAWVASRRRAVAAAQRRLAARRPARALPGVLDGSDVVEGVLDEPWVAPGVRVRVDVLG